MEHINAKINDVVNVIGDEDCEDFCGTVIGFREGFTLVRDKETEEVQCVDPECIFEV